MFYRKPTTEEEKQNKLDDALFKKQRKLDKLEKDAVAKRMTSVEYLPIKEAIHKEYDDTIKTVERKFVAKTKDEKNQADSITNKLVNNPPVPADGTEIRKKIRKAEDRFERFRKDIEIPEGNIYTNRKNDKPTHTGITQDTLNNYKKAHPENVKEFPKDVKNITPEQITKIYREDYYYNKKIDQIDDEHTARHMFDAYVNHSPKPPSTWLQKALNEHAEANLKVDGVVGEKTIKALNEATKDIKKRRAINNSIAEQRIEYYKALPNFKENPGWIPRANRLKLK